MKCIGREIIITMELIGKYATDKEIMNRHNEIFKTKLNLDDMRGWLLHLTALDAIETDRLYYFWVK